ncbi:hypothetical protein Dimus_013404, partial [Dionaea muscipula]
GAEATASRSHGCQPSQAVAATSSEQWPWTPARATATAKRTAKRLWSMMAVGGVVGGGSRGWWVKWL